MGESKLQRNRWAPLSVLTCLGRENWLQKCQENGKSLRRKGKRKGQSRMWRNKVKEKSLDDIMYMWILQKCQRQLEEDANTGGAMGRRGKLRGWEAQNWNPFATLQLKQGGEVENYLGALAISHPESRPDTAASIIHMTTVNEQDPNKSPLNSLGENWNIWLPQIWHHNGCF